MPSTPFPIHPDLTRIAIAFNNAEMIADKVSPRIPVGKQEFTYTRYDKADAFTVPNTMVGRTSQVNDIEFSATEASDKTKDYGIGLPIAQADLDNLNGGNSATAIYNPLTRGTRLLSNLLELDREVRVSAQVFGASSYAAANKTTLAGSTQWSDYTNSDPIKAILDAMDGLFVRPNQLILGQATWTKLRQHPKVVNALRGNLTNTGIVGRQELAALLEIQEIVVGPAWVNVNKPGQAPSVVRTWGKHAALVYTDPNITPEGGLSFSATAQWGTRIAYTQTKEPGDYGLRGGQRLVVGESVKELVLSSEAGYFFQNAIA